MTILRDQLKAGLSGKAPEPGTEPPSVSELAARIKALKAAHNIEAAPERVRQKQASAEEPVTARIRRRTKTLPVSEPAIQPDAPEATAGTFPAAESPDYANTEDRTLPEIAHGHPDVFRHGATKPHMTFQQRLAMERRHTDPEPSLS